MQCADHLLVHLQVLKEGSDTKKAGHLDALRREIAVLTRLKGSLNIIKLEVGEPGVPPHYDIMFIEDAIACRQHARWCQELLEHGWDVGLSMVFPCVYDEHMQRYCSPPAL